MQRSIVFLFSFVLMSFSLLGQGKEYEGPEDPAGDPSAEREGYMTGNRVLIYFKNTTEISDWPAVNASRWPNNNDGVKMVDGIGLLVGAKVYIQNDSLESTVDTIPLTELIDIYTEDKHTLYYLQTSYREEMDRDPTGTVEWGFYPVFGYFNEADEYPAVSNIENSWPMSGWPSTGFETKWPGEWNGRFGRGVTYADQECYYVVNDAQDLEYLGAEDNVKYYPRPGKHIGDLKPDVTKQVGKPWGGLGLRVDVRGFQWNNPQARDAIFWEYSIANISDYDLRDVAFGYWVDNGIGNDNSDDIGYFDADIDMSYSWDINGIGTGGLPTGVMGFAYLESPGLAYDYQDNDFDGLTDEKRDNEPTALVGPTDGITDLDAFLEFYKLDFEDLKEHWDADEDQDWEDGEDLNGDGVYQLAEYYGDDIGIDGVGPGELNYDGPDADGSECNHRPDFVEGVGCEPNFNTTDVSESDMVGLTSFRMFPIPSHAASNETEWFKNDQVMWDLVGGDTLEEFEGNISNLVEVFASGPFPLYQGRVERISMSELHSYDPLAGLNSDDHAAPALYELKRIVQVIYEKDYRFAQPPKMPTLTATAGDGEVILTWDDISDTRTRDPFVGNINDFEGYKVYRATDKYMADPEIITDGYGTPMFKKPLYQCDMIDQGPHNPNETNGMVHQCSGFTDYGMVNGTGYNLGNDSGINHIFVDNTVQNGRTYYYAIVAYDYGAPDIGPGISPSENNAVIELDEYENIRSIGKNVAIVTPRQTASGYVPPSLEMEEVDILGSGTVTPIIRAQGSLKEGHEYAVTFGVDTIAMVSGYDHGFQYVTDEILVYDVTYHKGIDLVIFNGMSTPPTWGSPFSWGGAQMYVNEGGGYDAWTNTLTYVQEDAWSGGGFNMTPPVDFSSGGEWKYDSLSFHMWSEAEAPTLRLQFEDGTDKVGFNFTPDAAGGWHHYKFALADFSYWDGSTAFDTSAVTVFQVLSEGNGASGRTFHFDNVWTGSSQLAYKENSTKYIGTNLVLNDEDDGIPNYWTLNPVGTIETDVFDGLQIEIDDYLEIPEYRYGNSGWVNGNGIMRVTPSEAEGMKMAWKYQVVFTDDDSAYVGIATSGTVRDELGQSIGSQKITNPALSFYVQNTSFVDSAGQYELMDMIIYDLDDNDTFNIFIDKVFVGATGSNRWRGTAFVLDFQLATEETFPQPGDVYQLDWKRPFYQTDTIRFTLNENQGLDMNALTSGMENIKVVPNPYVMTNMMEEAVTNPYLNQRRKLLFTHIPAECTIKIFTVSGVLVDEIKVQNAPDQGIVHWDMLTRESLEIAAGMYIYHVESTVTGDSKLGKFAVIK